VKAAKAAFYPESGGILWQRQRKRQGARRLKEPRNPMKRQPNPLRKQPRNPMRKAFLTWRR
jgi:hypothetical protein